METSILLVEDTLSDAELIREAFLDFDIRHRIDTVTDGEEALRILQGADKPHMVLLDLNLPKKSGLEVLREIRRDPDPFLAVLPVIVLTNSRSRKDVLQAYTSGCNAYIRKPIGFESLAHVLYQAGCFWCNCAILPESMRSGLQPVPSEPPSSKRKRKSKARKK